MTARRRMGLWGPLVLYGGLLFYSSGQNTFSLGPGVWDKPLHVGTYAGLGILALRAFHGGLVGLRPVAALGAFALTVIYGVTDEIHQSFVPGRDPSALDLLTDAIGAALAVGLFSLLRARRAAAGELEVRLIGRSDCPLCDEALERIEEVRREIPFRLVKQDVDEDPELRREVGDQVPVVLVNGKKVFKHRVDPSRLRRALRSRLGSTDV